MRLRSPFIFSRSSHAPPPLVFDSAISEKKRGGGAPQRTKPHTKQGLVATVAKLRQCAWPIADRPMRAQSLMSRGGDAGVASTSPRCSWAWARSIWTKSSTCAIAFQGRVSAYNPDPPLGICNRPYLFKKCAQCVSYSTCTFCSMCVSYSTCTFCNATHTPPSKHLNATKRQGMPLKCPRLSAPV